MDPITQLIFGALVGIAAVIGVLAVVFGLLVLALFTYFWTHAYPWLYSTARWAAKPRNLFSLILLSIILFVAALGVGLVALSGLVKTGAVGSLVGDVSRQLAIGALGIPGLSSVLGVGGLNITPGVVTFLLLVPPVLLLLLALLVVDFLINLGVIMWIARLVRWLFLRWRGLLGGSYDSLSRGAVELKEKAAALKETGHKGKKRAKATEGARPVMVAKATAGAAAPGRVPPVVAKRLAGVAPKKAVALKAKKDMGLKEKIEALRGELLGDVQRAADRLSVKKPGKKDMSLKEKMEELRSELLGDVRKAGDKLSAKKPGKKGISLKEEIEGLRSEFLSDVERARSKLSKKE